MKQQIMFALAAFAAAQAFAVSPVVVWDGAAGDFAALTKNGYTINLNAAQGERLPRETDTPNSLAADGSYFQIGNVLTNKTVTITYSGNEANPFGNTDVGGFSAIINASWSEVAGGGSRGMINYFNDTYQGGAAVSYLNGNGACMVANNGYSTGNYLVADAFKSFDTVHKLALLYGTNPQGGLAYYLDGEEKYANPAMTSYTFKRPNGLAIGGAPIDNSGKLWAMQGMKVYAVAIFTGRLTPEEIAAFKFHLTQDDLTAGEDNTITLDRDITMFVDSDVTVGKLTVTGPYTLTLAGAGAITASSLAVENGATVALADDASVELHLTQSGLASGDNTITLSCDTTLDVGSDVTVGKLTVTGPYTLTLAGAGVITASSLAMENGATVALADGTTLADGRIETTAVSGSGTVKYSGVAPDALECWDDSSVWTGTVWIVGKETLALNEWDPSALGSEASTLRLSGVKGYFKKGGVTVDVPVELDNDAYSYGLDLNNGWGNGAAFNTIATLKGSGTFMTESAGKNEVVRIVDASAFTGAMKLAKKIIIIGDRDGTLAETYRAKQNSSTSYPGEGALVIADDGVLNWNSATSLSYAKITSETANATIKVAAPWDLTPTLGTGVADAATWQGVVELAAMANDSSASIAFHADRMGNASSLAVVKGLTKGTNGKGFHLGSTACGGRNFRLDGDLDICNGSSNTTYSFGVLSGTGNFTVDTNFAGGPSGVVFNLAVKDYTGAITAVKPNDSIAVTVYCDALPEVGASILKLGAAPQTNAVEIAAVVAGGRTRTDLTYRVLERDGAWSFTRTGGYYIRLR